MTNLNSVLQSAKVTRSLANRVTMLLMVERVGGCLKVVPDGLQLQMHHGTVAADLVELQGSCMMFVTVFSMLQ